MKNCPLGLLSLSSLLANYANLCHAKKVKKYFFLSLACMSFIILNLFLVQSAYADYGPNSSSGEGDPNCFCENPDNQTAGNFWQSYNGIGCHVKSARVSQKHQGYCPTDAYCTMKINKVPVCLSKITFCREDNPKICLANPPATKRKPITDNSCWCAHSLADQGINTDKVNGWLVGITGGFNGRNTRNCTDGVDIYQPYDTKACSNNEYCTPTNNTFKDPQGNTQNVGSCVSLACNCENINAAGTGSNKMQCKNPDGTTSEQSPCTDVQVCSQKTANDGKASCQPLKNCTCDKPDTPGSGNNGYSCKMPDGSTYTSKCTQDNLACIQNADTTVSCKDETSKQVAQLTLTPIPTIGPPPSPPCAQYSQGTGGCLAVVTALSIASGKNGTPTDPVQFINEIFQVLLGVGGGVALLLIMFAGYRLMVSQGKPEAIQQAREQLIAAIVGILFFIFSIAILEAIGVDLLHLPGFGK